MNVERMRRHIESLAAEYDIVIDTRWVKQANRAYAIREMDGAADEVQIPPIRSSVTYATALHEIGHIKGRHQCSDNTVVRERWAWHWARANALIWTPVMERSADKALAWYRLRSAKSKG